MSERAALQHFGTCGSRKILWSSGIKMATLATTRISSCDINILNRNSDATDCLKKFAKYARSTQNCDQVTW